MYLVTMECEDGHIRRGPEQLRDYYYCCDYCGAQSPNVYEACTEEWAEQRLAELCGIEVSYEFI
jgi:hypothetical protein